MDRMARYKVEESIEDVIKILDSAPVHRDLIREAETVQLTNRVPIAHLAIERGLKALIAEANGTPEPIHSLNKLYRDLGKLDKASSGFLAKAFEDAVRFFGYNVNVRGFKHFRSLYDYLSKVGTDNAFEALRYWAIGETPKGESPIPYISPLLHRELLCALLCLFHPFRRWQTVSDRVERTVAHAMTEGRSISWSAEDTHKEHSVTRYSTWLNEHTSCCDAFREAVNQDFNIRDDEFVTQTLLNAWKDLRQSKDPAVRYYMSTLSDLPKGSQPRNPDAIPEVKWFDKDQTSGTVLTPAGTHLGFVEKYPDGRWEIDPSQEGPDGVPRTVKALADAKAFLVNRLTKQVTVTANEETKQLHVAGHFPVPLSTDAVDYTQIYDLDFWDANHGLGLGELILVKLQLEGSNSLVFALEGTVIKVSGQEVWIKGEGIYRGSEKAKKTGGHSQ